MLGRVFGGLWLDVDGTLQLLNSDHVRERDKGSAQSYPCWWCLEWVFCFRRLTVSESFVGSVGSIESDGNLFLEVSFSTSG